MYVFLEFKKHKLYSSFSFTFLSFLFLLIFLNLVLTELVRNSYEFLWFSEIKLVCQVNYVTVSKGLSN